MLAFVIQKNSEKQIESGKEIEREREREREAGHREAEAESKRERECDGNKQRTKSAMQCVRW